MNDGFEFYVIVNREVEMTYVFLLSLFYGSQTGITTLGDWCGFLNRMFWINFLESLRIIKDIIFKFEYFFKPYGVFESDGNICLKLPILINTVNFHHILATLHFIYNLLHPSTWNWPRYQYERVLEACL